MGELKRALNLKDAVAIGLGAVIGAGIFVVTGLAAGLAGPAFILGLLLAGFAAVCNGLSSAKLASVYPASGGTYEYGYRVLTPALGFAAGWTFLTSKLSAGAVVALGFGNYLKALLPAVPPLGAALAAILLLTLANWFGIKKVGLVNRVIVSVTLLILLVFLVTGLPEIDPSHFSPFMPKGGASVLKAAGLLFFAFTGYARITTLGEEVMDPQRTIPKAVVITLILSILLYSAVSLVALGTLGAEGLSRAQAPLEAAARSFNPIVAKALGWGACTAMLGVLLSQLLGVSRMFFAMARRRDLPAVLGKVNPAGVPWISLLLTSGILSLLVVLGTIPLVARTATFAILLYYSLANISALKMKENTLYPKWISLAGLITCLIMAFSMDGTTILSGIAVLAAGFLVRGLVKAASKRVE